MRRTDYRWIILATGFAILFFNGGSRSALGLMLKPMGDDLEWSRSALSLGITAYMLVSALAMPFVGRLADRFDMRWVMGTGVVVGAVGVGPDEPDRLSVATVRRLRPGLRVGERGCFQPDR